MKVIINNKQMPIPKKYSDDFCQLVETLLEKNPNVRPTITEILNQDYVKKYIAKFKLKNEFNLKDHESKISNFMHNNYPSDNSTANTEVSPQMNRTPLDGKINYQNYALVKEKFNSFKVNKKLINRKTS